MQRNGRLAVGVGLDPDDLDLYGTHKAKVHVDTDRARLIESGE